MPKLIGDERRIKQILMNLIRNAIKFTHEGFIKVAVNYTRGLQGKLTISVTDSGHGIAKEDMPLLFSRFGKLQRTAEVNHDGIGLGLNIIKQIVDAYEGEVKVDSQGLG